MTRADRQDRFAIRFGVCCVVFATVVQYRQHALWFQLPDPYQHATVNVGREATQTTSEVPNQVATHSRSGIRAARPRKGTYGTYLRADANALVSTTVHPRRLVRPRSLHPRQRRSLEREHGQQLLRGRTVLALDLGVSRWPV